MGLPCLWPSFLGLAKLVIQPSQEVGSIGGTTNASDLLGSKGKLNEGLRDTVSEEDQGTQIYSNALSPRVCRCIFGECKDRSAKHDRDARQ
jgi:hypothetical protein